MPSETVVNFNNDETTTDYYTECCEENGIVVPANIADNPYPGRQPQSYSGGCQDGDYDSRCNDSPSTAVVAAMEWLS